MPDPTKPSEENRVSKSIAAIALSLFAVFHTQPGWSQAYPDRPIQFVVPFTPGGNGDGAARLVSQRLSEMWNQPIVISNRPGAGGDIGAEAVAKAPADGYTWLLMSDNILTVNPSLGKQPFNAATTFAPVSVVARIPFALVTHPSVPANNVGEFIAFARQNPGKLNYGSAGIGTPQHLGAGLFENLTGVKMTHVPYKGSAAAITDLLSGQLQVWFGPATQAMIGYRDGNRVKVLASAQATRLQSLPALPTIAEAGVKGYAMNVWLGVAAPAGTPLPVIGKISGDIQKALQEPSMTEKYAAQGMEPAWSTPAELAKMIESDRVRWAPLVSAAAIKSD
jgi:tripartite-type tricarboxylate transporter receptor subunit TctC